MIRFVFLFFAPFSLSAQDDRATVLNELNQQIWIPFMNGVNTNDSSLFNAVNASDFHWVRSGAKGFIMNAGAYADDSYKVMQSRSAKGISTTVEVRFLDRTVSPSFAAEKCIMKYVMQEPGKDANVFYSILFVTSKKEAGRWKKQLQYVPGDAATAEQFAQAQKVKG